MTGSVSNEKVTTILRQDLKTVAKRIKRERHPKVRKGLENLYEILDDWVEVMKI